MKIETKTSPCTGISFDCIALEDGSLVMENILENTTFTAERVTEDNGNAYYLIPESAFEYKPTETVTEIADKLGVTRMAVWRLVNNGTLQAVKANGVYVVKSESVRRYLEERSD